MIVVYIAVSFIAGVALRSLFSGKSNKKNLKSHEEELKKHEKTLKNKLIEKDQEIEKTKKQIEEDFVRSTSQTREELKIKTQEIEDKTKNLDKKADIIEQKEVKIIEREKAVEAINKKLQEKEEEVNAMKQREQAELQKISRMSPREAREQLMHKVEEEATEEAQMTFKRIVENAQRDAQRNSVEILSQAIQRNASEVTQELTVSTVSIPDEDMKGRIIGREGRNIRAIEQATGVNLIIDDTPGVITISSFDGVRREVAKQTLQVLIKDGRIQPTRIEEVAEKIKSEIQETLKTIGEEAAMETGVIGIHDDIIKLLGKLKYRTSYGQNVLEHSISVSHLAGMMAEELEIDSTFARRAGLLHDIGKAIDREMEGSHVEIGAKLAKKYGESARLQNSILSHHEDCEPETAEAVLVQAADTISASRPGARREHLENYVKRITEIETIAKGFDGIKDAYCVSAGRELRMIVEPGKVNDIEAAGIAKMCAKKIEEQIEYPGEIRVTVIRSLRSIEIAK